MLISFCNLGFDSGLNFDLSHSFGVLILGIFQFFINSNFLERFLVFIQHSNRILCQVYTEQIEAFRFEIHINPNLI